LGYSQVRGHLQLSYVVTTFSQSFLHFLACFLNELVVGIWQKHSNIKEKESTISDANRPPASGSTGRWIHTPPLPPLRSFPIAFRPKSLIQPLTVTWNRMYTALRKVPTLNAHSIKSSMTSCMSSTPACNGNNAKPTGKNSTTRTGTNGTIGGQRRARSKPSLQHLSCTCITPISLPPQCSTVMAPTLLNHRE